MNRGWKIGAVFSLAILLMPLQTRGEELRRAYDVSMAQSLCDELPLDNVEGIWIYPDDNVSVLILRDNKTSTLSFPSYTISVVETSDARLHPGEVIGSLVSTAKDGEYRIQLSTERKNEILLKPKSVLANLNSDSDALIIKKQKSPFKARLNLNFTRLLPGFWKIVSVGMSQNNSGSTVQPTVGMVKVYPSYDGSGSSRRKVRYL